MKPGDLVRGIGPGFIPIFSDWDFHLAPSTESFRGTMTGGMYPGDRGIVIEVSLSGSRLPGYEPGCKILTTDGTVGWVNQRYIEVVP